MDSSRCFTQTLNNGLGTQPQETSPSSSPQHINYEQVLSTGKGLSRQLNCTLPKLQVCFLWWMLAQRIQRGCNQGYFTLLLISRWKFQRSQKDVYIYRSQCSILTHNMYFAWNINVVGIWHKHVFTLIINSRNWYNKSVDSVKELKKKSM